MGLDMYIKASKHFPKIDWAKTTKNKYAISEGFVEVLAASKLEDVATDIYGANVEVVAAYWRKANPVHNWFVKNVQDGTDDCAAYYLSIDKLRELAALCQKVIDEKSPHLLPPQEGFFFGNTDINQYYWDCLKDTIQQIDRILLLPNLEELHLEYQSSW